MTKNSKASDFLANMRLDSQEQPSTTVQTISEKEKKPIHQPSRIGLKHIGGYPPKYNPETKKAILEHCPQLFISGHSHILKVMYDDKLQCLHMNPGAAGKYGWHKIRTIIRFEIDGKNIKNCEVIELN